MPGSPLTVVYRGRVPHPLRLTGLVAVLVLTGCSASAPAASQSTAPSPTTTAVTSARPAASSASPSATTAASTTATKPTPSPSTTTAPKDTRTAAQRNQPFTVNGIAVVSKKHPISKRYQRRNPSAHGLEKEVAAALKKMTAAAKADGVKVKVNSAYRSYAEQDKLLKKKIVEYGDEKLARRYNAEPGKSEHQTGLAVDLWDGVTWGLAVRRTKTGKWLWKHAREYGFILRYPPDKEKITGYAYEPWHFRYIGVKHSKKFKANSKLTLEEYLGLA